LTSDWYYDLCVETGYCDDYTYAEIEMYYNYFYAYMDAYYEAESDYET
jgi:hypothetical protein